MKAISAIMILSLFTMMAFCPRGEATCSANCYATSDDCTNDCPAQCQSLCFVASSCGADPINCQLTETRCMYLFLIPSRLDTENKAAIIIKSLMLLVQEK